MQKTPPDQVSAIIANKHLPVRDIAKRVGVGTATVSRVLNAKLGNAGTAKTAAKVVTAKTAAEGEADSRSPIERLTACVKSLEHAAGVAAADGDQARVIAALRAVSDVTKTIATLTPPAPVDHDASPDVVEAARQCREVVFALFDRIVSESK